jgi:hypothetical protein
VAISSSSLSKAWVAVASCIRGKGWQRIAGQRCNCSILLLFRQFAPTAAGSKCTTYLTPCLHTHWGYGVDNPFNRDVTLAQRTLNTATWGNLIWDVTKNFQVGFEVSRWETDYKALPAAFVLGNNEGMIYHLRLQYAF